MASPVVMPPSDVLEYEDSDAEEGVDQLYSESDEEGNAASKKSSPKKVRPVGQTLLPQQRLENIIQSDGNLALSKEALFLVSLATEEFIKKLAQAGRRQADAERRHLIHYRDMSMATQQYQEFMFLQDTIPTPITLREAMRLHEAKEAEMTEENPAMLGAPSVGPSAAPSAAPSVAPSVAPSIAASEDTSISYKSTKTQKSLHTNGRSSGSSLRHEKAEHKARPTPLRESISASVSRTGSAEVQWAATTDHAHIGDGRSSSISQNGSTRANGESSAYASRSPTSPPPPSGDETKQSSPPYEPRVYGQLLGPGQPPPLAGPASGFLQDPNGPFVRASQIPGRTIYSQERTPQ